MTILNFLFSVLECEAFQSQDSTFSPSTFQFCSLGRLSHDVGWKYQDVIETLEAKRKVKAQDFYNKTVVKAKAVAEAEKAVVAKTKPIDAQMEAFGVC